MVLQSDIDILVAEGEGSALEYKEGLSTGFARELVAFANSAGGKVLVGVRDDGTVVGVKDSNTLRSRIQDMARNCDPPIRVLVETIGDIMVVTVRESENKPVQCKEGFFWRQGASTQKLTRDEIREFFQSEGGIRFDTALCPRFRYPEDFDREKFDVWLRESGISGGDNIEDVLVSIDVAERAGEGLVFRNAGVLFFAKNVQRFLPQAYVTCLLGKGQDKVHILDRKDFAGGVVEDIENSLRFIERNTRLEYKIETLKREEIPEYPMAALREAVTNAVMHRDYFQAGANVFVEIYSDRIEISNPGGLPKGLAPADLGTISVRRNLLIADLLHRIGYIEKAGTGIRRMREDAERRGCPEPQFKGTGFFTAVFRPRPRPEQLSGDGEGAETAQATDQVGTKSGPSRDQVQLLEFTRSPRAFLELMEFAGRSNRTKFRDQVVRPLLKARWMEMTIPDKPRSSKQRYRTTPTGVKAMEEASLRGSNTTGQGEQ